MRYLLKSSFFWQFAGGFAIGTIGLVALQPAEARHNIATHLLPATPLQR